MAYVDDIVLLVESEEVMEMRKRVRMYVGRKKLTLYVKKSTMIIFRKGTKEKERLILGRRKDRGTR